MRPSDALSMSDRESFGSNIGNKKRRELGYINDPRCCRCGKPTRSHDTIEGIMCHVCWLKREEDFKLKEVMKDDNATDEDSTQD